jgi:hypothetical protein
MTFDEWWIREIESKSSMEGYLDLRICRIAGSDNAKDAARIAWDAAKTVAAQEIEELKKENRNLRTLIDTSMAYDVTEGIGW